MTTNDTDKQNEPLHGPNLILDVENFGPIAEAKNIEFKPMTVFVGPSNTGKTYLVKMLHSILKAREFSHASYTLHEDETLVEAELFKDPRFDNFIEDIYPHIYDVFEDHNSRGALNLFGLRFSDFANESQGFLIEVTRRFLFEYSQIAQQTIANYFDVNSIQELAMKSSDIQRRLQICLRDNRRDPIKLLLSDHQILEFHPAARIGFSIDVADNITSLYESVDDFMSDNNFDYELRDFAEASLRFFPSTHYFRAGRTGLIDAYRELTATLIELAAARPRTFRKQRQMAVAFPTSEFLQALVRLGPERSPRFRSESVERVASVLERSVLGGKLDVKQTAGITHFEFDKNGLAIPLESASSMITELAPIVLFVRGFVRDGDLLIIDEPEAHLHPEAQQQMAAALAFMVRSGLRVLITTHSHYMVEQLSNFVAVSTLEPDLRKRVLKLDGALGQEDIYLDESEVAVYDFATDKAEHGSVVETVEFNQDYGYFPRDHNWAIADQMNRTQRVIEARIDQDDPVAR